jgi:hypothetical protein
MFMSISLPRKSGLRACLAASGFFTPLIAILILFAALAVQAVGQDEQPLIVPRKTLPQANKKPRGRRCAAEWQQRNADSDCHFDQREVL